jgi:ATP-dependent DNA helicase RecQ
LEAQPLLQKYFGFDQFRPGQESVIQSLLNGRSALAVFPTGGGKSLCYQLPALAFDGITLVVSPLIALMKDQIDFLTGRGIAAARLDSSLGLDETRAIGDKLAAGTLKLLYVAPERFNNERFLAQIGRVKLSMLAIDEAHCISEWGHNFRPDYLKIADFAKSLGAERVLALTATATPSVVADIRKAFDITDDDAIVTGFYRPNLRLATTPVTMEKRDVLLLERLQKRPPGPSIVYVTLQKTAERIAKLLSDAGLPAEPYHAGMESDERSAIQERWMASDKGIVVATIAFGMGIDKANVRYVYHYNLPKSLESYSQEIGRAGRDDQPSTVEMLACPDDVPTLQNFAYGDTPTQESLKGLMDDLLGRGSEFDVSLYDLSSKHDLRQLVLKTVLTYLELMKVLRQGTPFYAGYEFRPNPGHSPGDIAEAFPGEPGKMITDLFRIAKKGRLWYSLNPDDAVETLQQERRRITRALEVMEERGMIELRVADSRLRYYRLNESEDADALSAELMTRFAGREKADMERLQRVLDLVTLDRCQVNALTSYFGENRAAPCGHCGFCLTSRAAKLPPPSPLSPLPTSLADEMRSLRMDHPQALGQPRQMARFLCGLSSPALTKAKLSRNPGFASLEERPFAEVLSWCESL